MRFDLRAILVTKLAKAKKKLEAAKEKKIKLNDEAKSVELSKKNIESVAISRIEKYGDKSPPPPDKTPSHIMESIEAFILALALTLSEAMPRTSVDIDNLNKSIADTSEKQLTPIEKILKESNKVSVNVSDSVIDLSMYSSS